MSNPSSEQTLPKQTKRLDITPVILAGGHGKRLRPFTSPKRPKPFLKHFSRNSLFQKTLQRVQNFADPVIVTAAPFANMAFEQTYELGMKPNTIICEPASRGTAIAIACAAIYLRDSGTKMLVLPSDHTIENNTTIYETISQSANMPHEFILLTAKPNVMTSRYGYIVSDKDGEVKSFTEKPSVTTIKALAKTGQVFWNTGIFLCDPDIFLKRLQKYRPDIYQSALAAMTASTTQSGFIFTDPDIVLAAQNISVDYAVMEHSKNALAVPLNTKWNDIGTRSAYVSYITSHIAARIYNGFKAVLQT